MRRRTRHVIAVMVVATALCADRSVSGAAPVVRPQSQGFARSFASKLTTSLRRAVAPARVQLVTIVECAPVAAQPVRDAASGLHSNFSPFQFRLPPPSL